MGYLFKPYLRYPILSIQRSLQNLLVMKKDIVKEIVKIILPFFLLIGLASFSYGKFETKTVTGEILDMKCYMASGAHGPDHKECAAKCVKGGSPIGILADDSKVYLLIEGDKLRRGQVSRAGDSVRTALR